MTKTKIALAAVLFAATSSAALAQGYYDPNLAYELLHDVPAPTALDNWVTGTARGLAVSPISKGIEWCIPAVARKVLKESMPKPLAEPPCTPSAESRSAASL